MTDSISSDTYQKFRNLLIERRKKSGVTQVELAAKLKRPQQFISRYETGERRLDVGEFMEIADALDFDPVAFIRQLKSMRKM